MQLPCEQPGKLTSGPGSSLREARGTGCPGKQLGLPAHVGARRRPPLRPSAPPAPAPTNPARFAERANGAQSISIRVPPPSRSPAAFVRLGSSQRRGGWGQELEAEEGDKASASPGVLAG